MRTLGDKIGNSPAIGVRRMSAQDVPAVLSILEESPEASMWTRESLLESSGLGMAWTAEQDGRITGILIGRVAADEFEILNLAVGQPWRRKGVATSLVRAALEDAGRAGALKTYLEVRASNLGAIEMYRRLGFQDCGRRQNYYHDPIEDAVLLVLNRNATNP